MYFIDVFVNAVIHNIIRKDLGRNIDTICVVDVSVFIKTVYSVTLYNLCQVM